MVRLDLCVDHNGGRVTVYYTDRGWGGGSESMDQKGRREVGVGLCIITRTGREVGSGGGGG